MKDLILIPTYNEKENIEAIIRGIFDLIPNVFILVIDDNSPDRTALTVKALMAKYPRLSLMERAQKTGLGNAYKEAITRVIKDAETRAVIMMDADGSHDPKYLLALLASVEDYDLVVASRYIKNAGITRWEHWRRILSKFGNLYAKFLTGLEINDLTSGFMCIRREYLEKVDFSEMGSNGYSFLIELKFHLIRTFKARAVEIPIVFQGRGKGESKISARIIMEGIKAPARIFWLRLWGRK